MPGRRKGDVDGEESKYRRLGPAWLHMLGIRDSHAEKTSNEQTSQRSTLEFCQV